MKKVSLITSLLVLALVVFSQKQWVSINSNASINPEIDILETFDDGLTLKLSLNSYMLRQVETPNGVEVVVNSPECPNVRVKGLPDLPYITTSLNIPNQGGVKVEVISSTFETLSNISVAPSKGSLLRKVNPADVPYEYGRAYQIDEFLPMEQSSLGEPYILRDLRGINLELYPFSYNAVDKELRIYSEIVVRIKYNNNSSKNELASNKNNTSEEFIHIYNKAFLNYQNSEKYIPVGEGAPGKMLIICADDYQSAMPDFVQWKKEKGIDVELVLMSTVGSNSNDIKSYVQDYYNNNGISFLLLIGDTDKVPTGTNSTGDDSDNIYSYVAGNDGYADILMGRFSANSIGDVETQVERMINYERDLTTSATWLNNAFGSASSEGAGNGHDGGESDVQHLNNIKTDLENYGYTVSHVNQSGGSNSQISNIINDGVGIANYIGHGDITLWVNTNFTNDNVNALTNENKLPFIWSVACVNGDFNGNTCFGEAWLRATNNGNPTGAIGFIGSTINQSWTDPMTAQDEMVDILVETYSTNIKRTYGGLSFNGMFQMIEEGGEGQRMADTWTLFGDPSLMVRTKTPTEMTINHLSTSILGETQFTVNCNEENALVALTKVDGGETVIVGYGYVSGGVANVTITPFDAPGTMKVTVTAFNKVTYRSDVEIAAPDGPYVIHDSYSINDADENNNGVADYKETININQVLRNVGISDAQGVSMTASTANTDVNILNPNADFGNIAIDNTSEVADAFSIEISDGILDQTNVMIDLEITDEASNNWTSSYGVLINAPDMKIDFMSIDDSETGNGNNKIDQGETVKLILQVLNEGHATSEAGNVTISTTSTDVTINTPTLNFDAQEINTPIELEFEVAFAESIPAGQSVCFDFNLTAGMYSNSLNTCFTVGLQIEDWESGTITKFPWENDNTYPWEIVTNVVYEGENALKSGSIAPSTAGVSSLKIDINVLSADDLEFYKKVSCEKESNFWGMIQMYDYLSFSIDGAEQDKWCGEVDWSLETYTISAGEHELKWTYQKDDYTEEGSDCAWIDNIKLPSHETVIVSINDKIEVAEDKFEVYPNPANDIVYLNVELVETTKSSVKILNTNGQVVYQYAKQFNILDGKNTILLNTSELSNGYYIIELSTGNKLYHRNLTIAR